MRMLKRKKCSKCLKTKSTKLFYPDRGRCIPCHIADVSKSKPPGSTTVSFLNAQAKCFCKKHKAYRYCGGQGIKFKFKSVGELIKDIGERKKGMYLTRINLNGHYEPGNVRWVDKSYNRLRRTTLHTEEDVNKILSMHSKGMSINQIQLCLNKPIRQLYFIVNGK